MQRPFSTLEFSNIIFLCQLAAKERRMSELGFGPVVVKNVRYSELGKLSTSLKTYAGSCELKMGSAGPGKPVVDVHCWFPSRDDSILFKLEWKWPDRD